MLRLQKNKFTIDFIFILLASGFAGLSAIFVQSLIGYFSILENIGIYAQIFTLYLFFTTISNFGVEISTLKHASQHSQNPKTLKKILTTSSLLISIISLVTLILLYQFSIFFPKVFSSTKVLNGFIFSLPAIFLFSLNKNFSAFLSGLRNMRVYSSIRICRWFFILFFSYIFFKIKLDFEHFFIIFFISELIIFSFSIFFLKNYFYSKFNLSWLKTHLKYGITNLISLIFSVLTNGIIIIISGYYLTEIQTSKISFIAAFSSIYVMISNSIQINFNPIFARKWSEKDFAGIHKYLNMIFSNTLKYSLFIYTCLILLYFVYCQIFMEKEFNDTYVLYAIFSLGTAFSFVFSWPSVMLFLSGKIIQNLHRSLITGALNLIITYACIKYLGFYGTGFAILTNSIISILISYKMIYKHLQINLYSSVKESAKLSIK